MTHCFHVWEIQNDYDVVKFAAQICDIAPTNDPNELEELAVETVLDRCEGDAESEWIDTRTVEVTVFKFR